MITTRIMIMIRYVPHMWAEKFCFTLIAFVVWVVFKSWSFNGIMLAEVITPRQSRPQWYVGVHCNPLRRCSTSPFQVRSCSSTAKLFYNTIYCLSTCHCYSYLPNCSFCLAHCNWTAIFYYFEEKNWTLVVLVKLHHGINSLLFGDYLLV